MAKLKHYKNSHAAMERAEAVNNNMYEVTISPPDGITKARTLDEEVFSITGLDILDASEEIHYQKSHGHDRLYASPYKDDTTVPLTMIFNLNLHGADKDQNIIYDMFKEWQRRKRDDRTGANSFKDDQVGTIIIKQRNVKGFVWRMITLNVVYIKEIEGFDDLGIENGEPVQLTVNFHAEQPEVIP